MGPDGAGLVEGGEWKGDLEQMGPEEAGVVEGGELLGPL